MPRVARDREKELAKAADVYELWKTVDEQWFTEEQTDHMVEAFQPYVPEVVRQPLPPPGPVFVYRKCEVCWAKTKPTPYICPGCGGTGRTLIENRPMNQDELANWRAAEKDAWREEEPTQEIQEEGDLTSPTSESQPLSDAA